MAKLSKADSKGHQEAMDLVHSDRTLTLDERIFVLAHYHESRGQLNSLAGAFFTPEGLARDLSVEVGGGALDGGSIVDLCAGIGMLSFWCSLHRRDVEVTCVEQCEEYVTVGRRVVPHANWIHGDVFAAELGRYAFAISNPPFGRIKESTYTGPYKGGEFEFKVIERASQLAEWGVFILPQQSAPFRYSGESAYRAESAEKVQKFMQQTGIVMQSSCGIDTSIYLNEWKGVAPMCEVVCCDFSSEAPAEAVSLSGNLGLFAPSELPIPASPKKQTRRERLDRKAEVERKARAML